MHMFLRSCISQPYPDPSRVAPPAHVASHPPSPPSLAISRHQCSHVPSAHAQRASTLSKCRLYATSAMYITLIPYPQLPPSPPLSQLVLFSPETTCPCSAVDMHGLLHYEHGHSIEPTGKLHIPLNEQHYYDIRQEIPRTSAFAQHPSSTRPCSGDKYVSAYTLF